MGIVHHANYLRFCEEARVSWCQSHGLLDSSKSSVFKFAVYETLVRHLAPSHYGDKVIIDIQVQAKKAKLIFQYRLHVKSKIIALVQTIHCHLSEDFKVLRLDKNVLDTLEKEIWIETWL